MGKLLSCTPTAAVEFEGGAASILARLSRVAVDLHSFVDNHPEHELELKRSLDTLDQLLLVMDAIEDTITVIEESKEAILEIVADGDIAEFRNGKTGSQLGVEGTFRINHRTVRIQDFRFFPKKKIRGRKRLNDNRFTLRAVSCHIPSEQ